MTVTTVSPDAVLSAAARRDLVQATARRTFRRRLVLSRVFMTTIVLAVVVAFVPLVAIMVSIVSNGWRFVDWTFLTTPQLQPGIYGTDIGGISNAITGSLLIDGFALVLTIPTSIVLAIVLFESKGRVMAAFRRVVEVMVGLPSILFGIFVFEFVVTPMGYRYTALAGSIALALLMLPVMTVASEAALVAVPPTLSEAALALGARKSRIMGRVLLPYAIPRMLTGVLLALSRAVGETAPVLLIINSSLVTHWNLMSPQSVLPLLIFNNIGSYNKTVIASSWGIALVLIVAVFCINLTSRLILARSQKGRS
jgi:phosphate transport system permease protein